MAAEMLQAVNKPAWDSLSYLSWTFPGGHHYVWDKIQNHARISWGDFEVHMILDQVDGIAFKAGEELEGSAKSKAIKKAWKFWCNDSYWLLAPTKIFDPGTRRYVATDKEGKTGLLVRYESGGVTPGDEYLWFLDDTGLPTGFKMWVKIIPVGGVQASWEDWKTLPGGAVMAETRNISLGSLSFQLEDVKSGQNWQDLGFERSPITL